MNDEKMIPEEENRKTGEEQAESEEAKEKREKQEAREKREEQKAEPAPEPEPEVVFTVLKKEEPEREPFLPKLLIVMALLLVGVVSFTFFAENAMSVERHAETIASLDEKKDTVMALTASSTLASAVVSAIPDDTATPISEKLADLSNYFLLVLCVLYAEKYLLTVLGFASFRILIPAACLFLAVYAFRRRPSWKSIGIKLFVCALAAYIAIPASVFVSDMIYDTYETSISETISQAEQFSEEAEKQNDGSESLWNKIVNTATSLKNSASHVLNAFVEALAVMIVTSCLIPVLVLLFFIWLIKTMTGISIPVPKPLAKHAAVGAAEGDHTLPEGK